MIVTGKQLSKLTQERLALELTLEDGRNMWVVDAEKLKPNQPIYSIVTVSKVPTPITETLLIDLAIDGLLELASLDDETGAQINPLNLTKYFDIPNELNYEVMLDKSLKTLCIPTEMFPTCDVDPKTKQLTASLESVFNNFKVIMFQNFFIGANYYSRADSLSFNLIPSNNPILQPYRFSENVYCKKGKWDLPTPQDLVKNTVINSQLAHYDIKASEFLDVRNWKTIDVITFIAITNDMESNSTRNNTGPTA